MRSRSKARGWALQGLYAWESRGGQAEDAMRVLQTLFSTLRVSPANRPYAEVLVRLAGEAGLDPEEVRKMLASDEYTREVRADEAEARTIGISGVPFFVFGGRYGVSGAQPMEPLLRVLEQTWAETAEEPSEAFAEGAVCGPDGCA